MELQSGSPGKAKFTLLDLRARLLITGVSKVARFVLRKVIESL